MYQLQDREVSPGESENADISDYTNCHSRSGVEEVDEREIFRGSENKLTMRQTYTHKFQCLYRLHEYPFDAQVT